MLVSDDHDENGPSPPSSTDLLRSLQSRASALLREFQLYQTHLKARGKQQQVETRAFKRGIESEVKILEKIARVFTTSNNNILSTVGRPIQQNEETPQLHALRSSNLPFYEAVWHTAKSCRHITALGKKMYFAGKHSAADGKSRREKMVSRTEVLRDAQKKETLVDIIADNGLQWIKISTLTEKRLLFEMAKEGWEKYGDFDDDSDTEDAHVPEIDNDGMRTSKLELVRLAEDLKIAAQEVRVQFRHPQIRFVLPKIREGIIPDVDAFLADLRATGAVVECNMDICILSEGRQLDLDNMTPTAPTVPLTSTINIDCTILLALISDISHFPRQQLLSASVHKSETYHKAIVNQIESEISSPMLPDNIYLLLAARDLECTPHAAQRMREIVHCMGTPSELSRAEILLGEGQHRDQSPSTLRQAFSKLSMHAVPTEIRFPVKVIDFDVNELFDPNSASVALAIESSRPFPTSVAARVKDRSRLTPINASVFFYGWVSQIVTLTSNRAVATELFKTINDILDCDDGQEQGHQGDAEFPGPLILCCETARSLIGKTKFK
ncbi:uncharacterized protein Z520_00458 [Fonsecaea multimorphosa CBS 102226]|uniref:DUF1308 domain-containing protein n=1 Tax=Fonsecaea multimorphosa CBS 102226 TaxID=1442371 RepID=A0A0D2J2V2_9EURO|nr:uncharacterized protein Z520_00458 [Fonsecaea multimorphosa CBS 102226]KIY03767.1 hypothetical protein Z520_00458 [Fonsecaea multimorphosa CBS 102226]OAL32460.1 hypothetical protein AYO22_00482 [Fonsecaea multimorphosa]